MKILLFFLLVLFLIYSLSKKDKRTYSHHNDNSIRVKPYFEEKISFNVQGVWAENSRILAFENLNFDDILVLKFVDNPYDENAIGVFNEDCEMLGFVPRDRYKLISTLDQYPENMARILVKDEYYSSNLQRQVYLLEIEVFLGYSLEFLEIEFRKIKIEREIHSEREQLKKEVKLLKANLKNLKEVNHELAISRLIEQSATIQQFNQKLEKEHFEALKLKPLLDELTVITNQNQLYDDTIDYIARFYDESIYTELQQEKIKNRLNLALNKVS